MRCPKCDGNNYGVCDSRAWDHNLGFPSIMRRRSCDDCEHREVYYEIPAIEWDTVRTNTANEVAGRLIQEAIDQVLKKSGRI